MNDAVLRAWSSYMARRVSCPDCAWLLYHLAADWSTNEGHTRPGNRRLAEMTGRSRRWVAVHLQHAVAEGHVQLARKGRFAGGGTHGEASEYRLPWLVLKRGSAPEQKRSQAHSQAPQRATSSHTSYGNPGAVVAQSAIDDGGAAQRVPAVSGDRGGRRRRAQGHGDVPAPPGSKTLAPTSDGEVIEHGPGYYRYRDEAGVERTAVVNPNGDRP